VSVCASSVLPSLFRELAVSSGGEEGVCLRVLRSSVLVS
jgi:hypothetical protein